jgi:hypothetical protein
MALVAGFLFVSAMGCTGKGTGTGTGGKAGDTGGKMGGDTGKKNS